MPNYARVSDLPIAAQLYAQVASGEKPEKAQVFFDAAVLNKYREAGGYRIIRTNTSGRISKPGGWSLDFGISGEGDSILHIPVESLVHRIPEAEKSHWLAHLITLPVSANFLKGLIRPGCLDDGDIRTW
ncbi:hypothetical protein [Alicyclobacillus macrosporangiidus]|jgi:hypothetical protein|nr:hypothetical protein [Alicyclobacillus macrosporangiidus]